MKVAVVSSADSVTGAARAAARLHRLQVKMGTDSTLIVGWRADKSWRVEGPSSSVEKVLPHLMPRINSLLMKFQKTDNQILHSPGWFGSPGFGRVQRSTADVVNLHWVNHDFLSTRQIGKLTKPVVWTLHDSWAFCGAEHCPASSEDKRYIDGYNRTNRGVGHSGIDIDRLVWNNKVSHWRRKMHIVTPSRWLADCARKSRLMGDWPITVVPNAIPLGVFRPWDKQTGRLMYDLPLDRPILLFGAIGGTTNLFKGWQYLQEALKSLWRRNKDAVAVVLGQAAPKESPDVGVPLRYVPHLFDDTSLAMLYSAVDAVVVPSRMENFPQMATEAQCCGVPVVGFNCGGMPDVVEHGATGYLARPYDADELAEGLAWALGQASREPTGIASACRSRAESLWNEVLVHEKYLEVYRAATKDAR